MPTIKLLTNINCKNCIRAVTPFLDSEPGIIRWEVDISDPGRILSVEGEKITEKEVIAILEKAGYKAQRLD